MVSGANTRPVNGQHGLRTRAWQAARQVSGSAAVGGAQRMGPSDTHADALHACTGVSKPPCSLLILPECDTVPRSPHPTWLPDTLHGFITHTPARAPSCPRIC